MLIRILPWIFFFALFSNNSSADTYAVEYTYNAFHADNKASSEIMAFDQVRMLLVKKIGLHIQQTINISEYGSANSYAKKDVEAVTANLTKINILEERWDKESYFIKADIEMDTQPILDALEEYKNTPSEEHSQLLKALNINEQTLQKTRVKIARLRKEIEHSKAASKNTNKITAYIAEINKLSTESIFAEAFKYHQQGEYSEAIKKYRKIAKQGNTVAQQLLGSLYMSGKGIEQDYTKATYWFEKAAKQKEAIAQYYLGMLYFDGKGVTKNFVKAADWLHKSAEQEDALAQYQLGKMYLEGKGVEQIYYMASHWLHKAAEHQLTLAQLSLGQLYSQGKGVAKNTDEALYWYKKAADQGSNEAISIIKNLNKEKNH